MRQKPVKSRTKRQRTVTTLAAASAHTGISVDTLKRLRDAGCDGFASSGRINADKVLAWVAENPDAVADDAPDYGLERALKTRVDRQRSELALEVERGRLIDVQTAKRIYVGEAVKLKSRLTPIPRRLAQRLAMEADPIKVEEAISREINDALEKVANG